MKEIYTMSRNRYQVTCQKAGYAQRYQRHFFAATGDPATRVVLDRVVLNV
jgi:hypothetical protein